MSGLSFDKIGDTGIFIGSYLSLEDISVIAKSGITGVLVLQTEEDFHYSMIDFPKMLDEYRKNSIEVIHFPIVDYDDNELRAKLHDSAKLLDKMVKQGLKVYVHCTAGMGRAPSVVITYLCLFKGMEVNQAELFVR